MYNSNLEQIKIKMELIIAGIIALILLIYLVYVLIKPEKF
jgi:K+-transporting ATPase KdpF subunit